ncbi:MAG: hypothetical protein JSV03_16365, partial [Planctomycetota bacterium]
SEIDEIDELPGDAMIFEKWSDLHFHFTENRDTLANPDRLPQVIPALIRRQRENLNLHLDGD